MLLRSERTPCIKNMESEHDRLHAELQNILEHDIELEPSQAHDIVINAKQIFAQYHAANISLVERKISVGSTQEAASLRKMRISLRKELNQFITLINDSTANAELDAISQVAPSDQISLSEDFTCTQTPMMAAYISNNIAPNESSGENANPTSITVVSQDISTATSLSVPTFSIPLTTSCYFDKSDHTLMSNRTKCASSVQESGRFPTHFDSISKKYFSNNPDAIDTILPVQERVVDYLKTSLPQIEHLSLSSTTAPPVDIPPSTNRGTSYRDTLPPHFMALSSSNTGAVPYRYSGFQTHSSSMPCQSNFQIPSLRTTYTTATATPRVTFLGSPTVGSTNPNINSIPVSNLGDSTANLQTGTTSSLPFNEDRHLVFHNQLRSRPLVIDAASHHLLRQNLMKAPPHPFNGDPQSYYCWLNNLNAQAKDIQLDAWDLLCILEAHTIGKPQHMIRTHMKIGGANPVQTFRTVQRALYDRFGSGEQLSAALKAEVLKLPPIKSVQDLKGLEAMWEVAKLIEANFDISQGLQVYHFAEGTVLFYNKLPELWRRTWDIVCQEHKRDHFGTHPPFQTFIQFIERKIFENTNAGYNQNSQHSLEYNKAENITARRTKNYKVSTDDAKPNGECPLHPSGSIHKLPECREFLKLDHSAKRDLMYKHNLCSKCMGKHSRSDCRVNVTCSKCHKNHHTSLHYDAFNRMDESTARPNIQPSASSYCAEACGTINNNVNCSKTVLVQVTASGYRGPPLVCYAILDDQSSNSFADPKVAKFFNVYDPIVEYTLSTLGGHETKTRGVQLEGLIIKGVNENKEFRLPTLLANDFIPDNKNEVASPSIVASLPHVSQYAKHFNNINNDAEVLLLLGRDFEPTLNSKIFGKRAPYVHQTSLGWALLGYICPKKRNLCNNITSMRTNATKEHFTSKLTFPVRPEPLDIFKEYEDDELLGVSKEDQRFLSIVKEGIHIDDKGYVTIPLPFKEDSPQFQDNRTAVFNRSLNTLNKLKKDPNKLEKSLSAMEKNINSGHVEVVPASEVKSPSNTTWFIPVFPVSQLKKDKVRLVFDSSAKYNKVSLNSLLLQGPDVNNALRAVLHRFRRREVGISADIEAMFHNFKLEKNHRDLTRFFWYKNNDPMKPLVQYRATVHVFGNTCSPALATMGLRYASMNPSATISPETLNFISYDFYVDDGLTSTDNASDAIKLLQEARTVLQLHHIRLHKISSNSATVMNAFPKSEVSEGKVVEINKSVQATLGLSWDTVSDSFILKISVPEKPFTKRGVLATVNSIYDPVGFVCPVTLTGKLLQRKLIPSSRDPNPVVDTLDWDDPLPNEYKPSWEAWKSSLTASSQFQVKRSYVPPNFGSLLDEELHVFADASAVATGYVIYYRGKNLSGQVHVAFVSANSKVPSRAATSIPRLELCATLDASISGRQIASDLGISSHQVYLYSDSQVVIGYLNNKDRCFTKYVTRRVNLITKCFQNSQWSYISSEENPADIASRPQDVKSLLASCWFRGPEFLWSGIAPKNTMPLLDSESLPESIVEPIALVTTKVVNTFMLIDACLNVSSLGKAIFRVSKILSFIMYLRDLSLQKTGISLAPRKSITYDDTLMYTIKEIQAQAFSDIKSNNELRLPERHHITKLSPFLDDKGVIRVGGRLKNSQLLYHCKFPILLPSSHQLTILILKFYHEKTHHQGRIITHSAIRQGGYFIMHGSKTVKNFLLQCVPCRKLRGTVLTQKMNDLPEDRLENTPPFTNTGMDVLGPYNVTEGRATRKNSGVRKLWAVLFTCLVSRAIHLEPLPSMDTASLKNALTRFYSLRGTCKILRSDQGTNFIGARNEEQLILCNSEIETFIRQYNCQWVLNPPKASHFGGVWERQVGSVKRILSACSMLLGNRYMTRDEFSTFLAEAASTINNTPMYEVSGDPNEPMPLTPANLLTFKDNPNPPPLENFDAKDLLAYGSRRWRRVQYLAEQFWSRWRREYIHQLQERSKWVKPRPNLKPNDIVLIRNREVKRNQWPLARVFSVKHSKDGLVRSAVLSLPPKNGLIRTVERPITELVLLVSS